MKKLSTVVLKKTKGIEQNFTSMKHYDTYCVLGAVSKAVGIEPREGQLIPGRKLRGIFPVLKNLVRFGKCKKIRTLETVIMDLNDRNQWSFKRIGNWLKKQGF